jgi:YggT family protein
MQPTHCSCDNEPLYLVIKDGTHMLGDIVRFLLEISASLFGAALLARAWIHAVRLHPFNPMSQAIHQATNWLILPLRKILPAGKTIDWASLLAALLIAVCYLILMWVVSAGTLPPPGLLPAVIGAAVVTMARWALNLVVWMTLIQAVLSWVNPLAAVMPVLRTLTEPLLLPIRRIMPQFGSLDLSPIALLILAQIAMMVLNRISFSLFGV